MVNRKTYYSVSAVAKLAGLTPRAVQLRLQNQDIEPDADLIWPGGRRAALFEEKTLAVLLDRKPKEIL